MRVSVCLSVRGRMPTLLHGPGSNLVEWKGMPPRSAQLGGFAIDARVALLWQHNTNPSYKCEREMLASALYLLYPCFIQ